ncbi:MAG TPA: YciI family protein [Tepidiformaceae bacterium]|nr:YciI family protein [Tepidiformaceae bacterium]
MALFLLLIYEDESAALPQDDPRWKALWDAYVALDEEAKTAGALVDSQPLRPSAEAETLTVARGSPVVAPGVFRAGPHQLTGYYLVRCAGIEAAREWAAKIPAAATGGAVEIRQVLEPQ